MSSNQLAGASGSSRIARLDVVAVLGGLESRGGISVRFALFSTFEALAGFYLGHRCNTEAHLVSLLTDFAVGATRRYVSASIPLFQAPTANLGRLVLERLQLTFPQVFQAAYRLSETYRRR